MAYVKINFTSTTLLTPTVFNTLETQYTEVISYWGTNSFRDLTTESLVVEVQSTEPAPVSAGIYYDSVLDKLRLSDGSTWWELEYEV